MERKGAASLDERSINVLKRVGGGLDLRIERINQNIGRVYVVDERGEAQKLPTSAEGGPMIKMEDGEGGEVAPHNQEFLYMYAESYRVKVNEVEIMRLDQQKQHTIMAPREMEHERIEM
jgi:hypothetical protein